MDFKDSFKQLSDRVLKLKEQILTEEATKNAFIMPFIQMLGYDVFNPLEVIPEMDCDLIKKKGDKIDYAIVKDGEPIMLIECKHWKQDLTLHDNQLQKYFVASKAKFGVLTNGVKYRFYTDLVKVNIMDEIPFLEIDLENHRDAQIEEVKKFHKSYFDIDSILSSASELKYMSKLRNIISQEFASPTPDFVKYFGRQVYDGQFTAKITEQFSSLVKRTINSYINDLISERLKAAMETEDRPQSSVTIEQETPTQSASGMVTTDQELEGFYIVKAILRNTIKAEDIIYKDSLTRFSVFYIKNKGQSICQFQFDGVKKKIRFQTGNGEVDSFTLDTLDTIFDYSDRIIESAKSAAKL